MVEGQEGVSWEEWVALARACEEAGLDGLFRSDHYLPMFGDGFSLDAWATLAGLAAVTSSLRLGTLVSPVTFRRPAVLANMVATVDRISGGRAELGLGAGWNLREHETFGFAFPSLAERMDILEQQLEDITRRWAELPPAPLQQPHPPIVMGGAAGPRAAGLAARFADEYNMPFASVEDARAGRERVAAACEREGREPIAFSLMAACCLGRDRAEAVERAANRLRRMGSDADPEESLGADNALIGTVDDVAARIGEYAAAGVERVYLQHLDHRDVDMVRLIGDELVPALA